MYATQFSQDFTNNQYGLPDEISRLKIIASFTINYVRLSFMIFFSNSGYVTSIIIHLNVAYLKAYWEVVYRADGFI